MECPLGGTTSGNMCIVQYYLQIPHDNTNKIKVLRVRVLAETILDAHRAEIGELAHDGDDLL